MALQRASLRTPHRVSRETVTVLLYTRALIKGGAALAAEVRVLFRSLRHELDPLDLEILERAFDATCAAVKENDVSVDFDSDEGLGAILRRELIEIACFRGVSDPETMRDILLARLPAVTQTAPMD